MSPYTTPIAPMIIGSMRAGGRADAVAELTDGSDAARGRSPGGAVVGAACEADVQLLELAIEMGALEPGLFGDLAHVALLAPEQLLEIDPLEGLARLAQRQLEEARRDLGGDHLVRRGRLAEQPLYVVSGDLAAHDLHVGDDALQMIQVAGPVGVGQRGQRSGRQRGEQRSRALVRGAGCAPAALDQLWNVAATLVFFF